MAQKSDGDPDTDPDFNCDLNSGEQAQKTSAESLHAA